MASEQFATASGCERGVVCVVAAHPDDEVLGCGGTMARMASEGYDVRVLLMADGETSRGSGSQAQVDPVRVARRGAAANAASAIVGARSVQLLALPDNRMDSVDLLSVVQHVEAFVHRCQPSIVFTHHAGDVNIDHRLVHDAVVAACRPQPGHCVKTMLFFEVPSSTEWRPPASATPFCPNWFVDVSRTLGKKVEALKVYSDELRPFPHPRSLEGVEVLAKWRGVSVGVKAAEAFVLGRNLV